jgi:hypothetical protein
VPPVVRHDILVNHLTVPSVRIDIPVQLSLTIPDTVLPPPGCPVKPLDTTFTVPNSGVATPKDPVEGLEGKSWIFGHSRWQGVPGVFFVLQDMKVDDELFVDGVDRSSGEQISHKRFVVTGLYLTDLDSGDDLVSKGPPKQVAGKSLVMLQTSVREEGAGKSWILGEEKLRAKTVNLVQGDLKDPCKYLLLFVVAQEA